ncbi:MAG: hypothetical protein LIP03_10175, partial [Bacteroidales bacterium]|nr:hypothetical protein [Bacteroidales bacterium]
FHSFFTQTYKSSLNKPIFSAKLFYQDQIPGGKNKRALWGRLIIAIRRSQGALLCAVLEKTRGARLA